MKTSERTEKGGGGGKVWWDGNLLIRHKTEEQRNKGRQVESMQEGGERGELGGN